MVFPSEIKYMDFINISYDKTKEVYLIIVANFFQIIDKINEIMKK